MADQEKVRREGLDSDQARGKLKRRTFLGAIVALLAAANGWLLWAKSGWGGPSLKVAVTGPFKEGAETSLKEYKSNFVALQTLRVEMRDPQTAKLNVAFSFEGKKDSARKIKLDVVLRDVDGKTIGSRQLYCDDQRIRAEKPVLYGSSKPFVLSAEKPVLYGSSKPFVLSPDNSESIKVHLTRPAQVHSVEMTFQPA
jgi:hypothetical protein